MRFISRNLPGQMSPVSSRLGDQRTANIREFFPGGSGVGGAAIARASPIGFWARAFLEGAARGGRRGRGAANEEKAGATAVLARAYQRANQVVFRGYALAHGRPIEAAGSSPALGIHSLTSREHSANKSYAEMQGEMRVRVVEGRRCGFSSQCEIVQPT